MPLRLSQKSTGMTPEEVLEQDIVIAFMGPTGTGKSTFIDLLTREEGKRSGKDLESVTQDVDASCVSHPQSGKRVVLVDTPGFDDTNKTELQVLRLIADWLEKTYRRNITLSGIIYLHSIAERRMQGSLLQNLHMFKRLCGDDAMSRVVLTTTMWKDVELEPKLGEDRQKQLEGKFWQEMISQGATVDRLKWLDHDEAWRVVNGLIEKHGTAGGEAVQLQAELVDLGRSLSQTEAGKALYASHMESLKRVECRHKEILRERKESRDPTTLKELNAELAELEDQIKMAREEIAKLKERRRWLSSFQALFRTVKTPKKSTPNSSTTHNTGHKVTNLASNLSSQSLDTSPLARLVTSDVLDHLVTIAGNIESNMSLDDVQVLADYLDLILDGDTSSAVSWQNRILTLLAQIAVSARAYPNRCIIEPIEYDACPVADRTFGEVYEVLQHTICVKVMKGLNDEALKSCAKELILWSRLSHTNILPLFGVFFSPSSRGMCLVSPWMKNGNLISFAAELSQKDRMPLLSDVTNGLNYLHELGIVHGDIRGQNVLVSDEGRALITDSMLSRVATGTMKQGGTQSSFSNLANFAAPEILEILFESAQIRPNQACDIWSFGCLCYEILTRKIPFLGLTKLWIFRVVCIMQDHPTRPVVGEVNGEEINDKMWALMLKCWEFDPDKRPTCHEIQKMIALLVASDNRPLPKTMAKPQCIISKRPSVDLGRVEDVLRGIQEGIQT